jgi:CDP-glycerol glycerophosphotransferase
LRIVRQPNQGLGAARNSGVEHATGEFLWFVDSDDLLLPGAIPLLLGTITATGSDLATGNVTRLAGEQRLAARFLAETFARTRLRTNIRRFPNLIADRVAWNKVYRRSFWDHHGFRFPVGVHYEDQYVTLPAHYLARSVDVRHEPVYLWRVRNDSDSTSITQQRADLTSMRDRVRAVTYVSEFLKRHGSDRDKRRYDVAAVTHDLSYFLDMFDSSEQSYQRAFIDAANGYLATVDPHVFDGLPAVRRLAWELVRRGDAERVAEAVRFGRDELRSARAVRSGRQWYAPLPGRHDAAVALPASVFAVTRELRLVSTIDDLTIRPDEVRIDGHAAIDMVGPVSDRLQAVAIPLGGGLPHRLETTVDEDGRFEVRFALGSVLGAARPGHDREWRVVLYARDHGLRRIAAWHERGGRIADAGRILTDPANGSLVEVRVQLAGRGRLTISATSEVPTVTEMHRAGDWVDLVGAVPNRLATATGIAAGDARFAVHAEAGRFLTRLPATVLDAASAERDPLELVTPAGRHGIALVGGP